MAICFNCGRRFHASRNNQLYCSLSCGREYRNGSRGNDLILTLKKKWFDMILCGLKKEEYREMKAYWEKRFGNYFTYCCMQTEDGKFKRDWLQEKKVIRFRNGYQKNAPEFRAEVTITEKTGNIDWGAEPNTIYYVLTIHRIFGMKNNCCLSYKDGEEDESIKG